MMTTDSLRISQVLPTVKCSKCSAAISMDDMSTHVCSARNRGMPSITEAGGQRHDAHVPTDRGQQRKVDRGIFNSAHAATRDYTYREKNARYAHHSDGPLAPTTPTFAPSLPPPPPLPPTTIPPSTANANAVLGRIHNLKTGVLDSSGIHRPVQQSRLGPIQTRDPRATMVPIRTDVRRPGRRTNDMPRLQEMSTGVQDDDMSVTSGRSGRSQKSSAKSSGSMQRQQEELFASSLSSTDSGPFHHVSSRLDPTKFVPADVSVVRPSSKGRPKTAGGRSRFGPRRSSFDGDWDSEGLEPEEGPYSHGRPSDIFDVDSGERAEHGMYGRPPVLANYDPARSRRQDGNERLRRPEQLSHSPPPTAPSAKAAPLAESVMGRGTQRRPPDQRRPVEADRPGSGPSMMSRHVHPPQSKTRHVDEMPPPPRPIQSARVPQSKSHVRNETSSSLGTLLTNSSFLSARSSVSSPPTSERNYRPRADGVTTTTVSHTTANRTSLADAVTPTPIHRFEDEAAATTPTVVQINGKTVLSQTYPGEGEQQQHQQQKFASRGLPRSDTTGSFDRLLDDIGESIGRLDVPARPFAGGNNLTASPSSNYSPLAPERDRFPSPGPQPAMSALNGGGGVFGVLGSPASLRSKAPTIKSTTTTTTTTTTSSSSESIADRAPTSVKDDPCRACGLPIRGGKSLSSADGSLTGRYHRPCLRCSDPRCSDPDILLRPGGGGVYVLHDRPFCATHYHLAAGTACASCGEGIEGDCLASNSDARRYHLHCHAAQRVNGREYAQF